MRQKKDTRTLGRRRKTQAQSQETITPGVKPSMPAPSPKKKRDRNDNENPPKSKKNTASSRLLRRVQATELREFTASQLYKFKPSGIISRAEKMMVRRRLAIVAVLLSLLAALLAGITNYALVDSTPRRAIDSYMSALEKGRYLSALGASVYQNDSTVLLKDSMYRASENRVEDYEITSLEEHGTTATATIAATVAGKTQSITLSLHKEVKNGIFNDQWELDTEPQIIEHITSPLALDSVLINGKKLRLGTETSVAYNQSAAAWNIPLLPGDYKIALSENSYYTLLTKTPTISVNLQNAQDGSFNLQLRPSQRMWNETNDAINSWLETCTNSRSLTPHNCPSSSLFTDDGTLVTATANPTATSTANETSSAESYHVKHTKITNVKWELTQKPILALEHVDDDFSHWNASNQTTATYKLTYTVGDVQYTETIPITIDAQVESTGDSARISAGLKAQGDATVTQKTTANATPSENPVNRF